MTTPPEDDGLQDEGRMMEVSEVAVRLNTSTKTVNREIADKQMVAVRVGSRWKVPVWAYKRYLASRSNVPIQEPEAIEPSADQPRLL